MHPAPTHVRSYLTIYLAEIRGFATVGPRTMLWKRRCASGESTASRTRPNTSPVLHLGLDT
jgi:hypothetical protein